jgi:hypothetical protein
MPIRLSVSAVVAAFILTLLTPILPAGAESPPSLSGESFLG